MNRTIVVCKACLSAALLLALAACSARDTNTDPSEPDSTADFKSASADNVVAGAGVTNVLAMSFTAPANGFAWVSATGTCGMVEPLPVSSVLAAQVETSATDDAPGPGDGEFEIGGGATASPSEGSFSVTRTLAALQGGNTVYLNIDNPSSGGELYCSASMSVLFTSHQLP